MSFRTRLTSFFILIVVVPMIAVGALVFRLIGDSDQGKADARAGGLASAAASLYLSGSSQARVDAGTIARQLAGAPARTIPARVPALLASTGLVRVQISRAGRTLVDSGARDAIAPGTARLQQNHGPSLTVTVSSLSASDLVHELTSTAGTEVLVRQSGRVLAASIPAGRVPANLPAHGTLSLGGTDYRASTQRLPGFGPGPVELTVFSDTATTSSALSGTRLVAAIVIGGFLLLAFAFSVLASRALEGQLRRFLEAARRLAGGDFSAPVPVEGDDDFASLGQEFNLMSQQLEQRLAELSQERARLRESIVRVGQTFASNLDRRRLLELALGTALDAVEGKAGRITVRAAPDEPLEEIVRAGDVAGFDAQLLAAERAAIQSGGLGEAGEDHRALSLVLGVLDAPGRRIRGLLTLVRPDRDFDDADRELLQSLASQATLALENVELHYQVRRQAVTDELTGLANHGSFQDLLGAEVDQVRRYRHPVGLIMVDIDNFKSVNDTYGHQQGDVVLKHVAHVLQENSRDADTPARYGGEEMALILPHTDLGGSYAIAERVRGAIESLRIARLDGAGMLRITASLGVAATGGELEKDELIAEADAALYRAKHEGKNRVVQALPGTLNVPGGE